MDRLAIVKNSLFDLGYLLSRESKEREKIAVLSPIINGLSLTSFCLLSDAGWNAPAISAIADFIVSFSSQGVSGLFYALLVYSALVFVSFAVVLYQLSSSSATTSVWLMKFIRISMGLSATLLFFPACMTLLRPLALFVEASVTVPLEQLVLAPIGLFFFLVPAAAHLLLFNPDITSSSWCSRADARHDAIKVILELGIAVTISFYFKLGMWWLWLTCAIMSGLCFLAPSFSSLTEIRAHILMWLHSFIGK